MKKIIVTAAAAALALVLAGCAAPAASSSSAASEAPNSSASASSSAPANTGGDATGGYISDEAAEQAAIASVGAGDPIDVDSDLEVGGDAPHYVVTLNYGGGDIRTVEVDALTGEVW